MHDLQSYLYGFAGQQNPFFSPYAGLQQQHTLNPLAGLHPLAWSQQGYGGFQGYGGIHPQQLQLAAILASQGGIPQLGGLSPFGIQNPWLHASLQNPLLGLQSHYGSPWGQQQYGQQFTPFQQSPFGQQSPYGQQTPYGQQNPFGQQNPYGQQNPFAQQSPYGQQNPFAQQGGLGQISPLAPQTWIGQQGGQIGPQLHPLVAAQLATRHLGTPIPWTGF